MSLNVGAMWVNSTDREQIVALIRQYWTDRGASPITTDPLAVPPLSLDETAQLGFAVAPPTAGAGDKAPMWTTVYDSQRYTADRELAAHLAEAMGVPVVVAEFHGSVDVADIKVYGEGGPPVPRSGKPKHWGTVEDFVSENLPWAFTYFNQLKDGEPGELTDWVVFGFEGVPYRKGNGYSGPSPEQEGRQRTAARAGALAAQGDVAGLRELWESHPKFRDQLIKDLDRDVEDETARRVYLAFAEEIVASQSSWLLQPLAEAAHRAGEKALFERVCAELGSRVSNLESYGVNLAQAGRFDEAAEVLSMICARPEPSISSWNNLAHVLCYHPLPLPAQARDWLTAADECGAANPHILHNSACAWLRLGERERAMAAVESAVRYGYPLLDRLRADEDLVALRDDPRFGAAFERTPHFADLTVTTRHLGGAVTVARPLLTMHFFLEPGPGESAGAALATLMRAYLDDVPPDGLTTRRKRDAWGQPLSAARIDKDLERLRAAGQYKWINLRYRGATDAGGGAPTPYGLNVDLDGRDRYEPTNPPVSTVRLQFPADECFTDPDAVVARFLRYAALVPYAAGGCGLELVLRETKSLESWWSRSLIDARTLRPLAFEDHPVRDLDPGAPGAAWLTLLGPELVAELGLTDQSTVAGPRLLTVGSGLCLRAATYPPIGLEPTDVATLPTVARLLRPRRLASPRGHYDRFDDLADGPFDNQPPAPRAEVPA